MTRVLYAMILCFVGGVIFSGGLGIVAGSEIALAALTLVGGALLASLGLYMLASGVVLLFHESSLTDRLKRWFE